MPGRLLPHHSGAQHQAMGGDFRLFRGFPQDRQEVAAQAHDLASESMPSDGRVKPDRLGKNKGYQGFRRELR